MRPKPRIPELMYLAADQLEEFLPAADPFTQMNVLNPITQILRWAADEFDVYYSRRVLEINELFEIVNDSRRVVPAELAGQIDELVAANPPAELPDTTDLLDKLADELDELLIGIQDWLESPDGDVELRARARALQKRRATRWLPPPYIPFIAKDPNAQDPEADAPAPANADKQEQPA